MKFLLILALVAPASSVTSGRVKSAGGAIAEDGGSPWLSLLTKSWALPGESQEEQNKGLDGLANSIVQLARSQKSGQAPDASMQAALESIKQILKDMKDAVTTTNAAAQTGIFKKQAAVAACKVPNATDKSSWEAGLTTSAGQVVSCRAEEKAYYDRYEHCKAEEARCSNTTECCAQIIQPNPYCLSQPVAPSPLTLETTCSGASKCREKDLHSKLGFFEAKLKEYNDAATACDSSRAGCNSSYACSEFKTQWGQYQAMCNMNQTAFEQAHCDLAASVEAAWESYTACHAHTSDALVKEESKQGALLTGRRQEWRGLLRIECLLDALSATDKETALQACIAKDVTGVANATLTLNFPTQTGNVTELAHCTEKVEAPGSAFFLKTYYASVPSVLLPESLTTYHCVSGVATSHCPTAASSVSLFAAKAHYMPRGHWGQGHLAHAHAHA